jgi:DNA-binding response OmpR family regulator
MSPTKSTEFLKVLSVSPFEEDHLSLQAIVGHSTWTLFKAHRLLPALAVVRQNDISVLLCECDLMPGRWTDVLESIRNRPHPPSLIVTSRLADERLWAEALNLGAWDVLAKPFDRSEVLRSVKAAWQHWHRQIQTASAAREMMRAAS